jgi:hypothetical protein
MMIKWLRPVQQVRRKKTEIWLRPDEKEEDKNLAKTS